MGVYSDFIAHTTVVDKTEPQAGGSQRSAYNELARHAADFDPPCPTHLGELDEVQTLNAFTATVSSGNYTITIVDENGVSHTTANIAYNANAATIEGEIDTKMTADAYSGWTNGDITVALTGDLATNAATLTYDGTSVTLKNMGQAVVADAGDLVGTGTVNGSVTDVAGITTNEVQTINTFLPTVSGGNYTITIVDELAASHTTDSILFSDVAATIESAIDTKMTADGYSGWTNGDISVALTGNLTANDATLTFDGDSVSGKDMGQATVADVDLTGSGTVNGATTGTPGATVNEVQTVNTFLPTVSGGNFTITIVDELAVSRTTGNILYDSTAGIVEAAIDVIMTAGSYAGWTNGDITVALGSDLTAGDATLTYDGTSVTGKNFGQATIATVDLTGSGTVNGSADSVHGATVNEVQTINTFTASVTGGNYTITIIDEIAGSHVTDNILWNAVQATIESAIDTKMTADGYTNWTNGDITVALTGNLTANDATLTYDGDSVTGLNMGEVTVQDIDLTGGGTVNGASTGTPGSKTSEVQTVNTFVATVVGGNFTINIVDELAASHVTANIAWDADAATIEAAIDVKMTADGYTGWTTWTNGDITVTLTGDLTANDATLTFDGLSVDGVNMGLATIADVDLVAGTVNGSSTGTPGSVTSEVQTVNTFIETVVGGTFTINILDDLAVNHTTTNIAYDADAATVEAAIDVAMTAYGSWTNGDITVALGSDLTAGDATLTYDGASVTGKNMGQATIVDVDLVAGTINGATTGTPGITTNEVQTLNTFTPTVSGGNYTINIVDGAAGNHVTANILYSANAATIEAAIDAKMTTDVFAGWTNGDISVALTGNLTVNDVTLTFDGDSVTGVNMGQATVADVDLTDSGAVDGQSTGVSGQAQRYAWSIMWAHGMIASVPEQGDALADGAVLTATPVTTSHWPCAALRKALAWQAAIDDDNIDLRTQLETLFKVA